MFASRDPYGENEVADPNEASHVDIEMILLDLL